jgi:predicted DCC family thiol-disulfide oxidoreductase YuxK
MRNQGCNVRLLEKRPETVGHQFEVFYDGACPLCRREIEMLKRMDRWGRVRTTDISSPAFDPPAIGKTYADLMARIHGRLADGTWVEGVEVFRQLYGAVGCWPLVLLTRLPGVSQLLDLGYRFFARHRLRLTGRCTAETCERLGTAGHAEIVKNHSSSRGC